MASDTNCLGLDIGSSTVKLCELRSQNEELHLETFDYTALPHEAIVDGEMMNVTAVADAISTLLDRNDVRRTDTALSISGNTVIIKKVTLPMMTQEELEESIEWEAEQFIPFDIEDVFIGFEVLAPRTEQGQMDVVLVAAKKEMINDYVGVCHRSGLDPVVVDVDSFAVQNMFELNYGFHENETVTLLDLGNSVISVNIVREGITSFTRDLSMGGADITEEIQRQLNVTYDEAESYKMGTVSSDSAGDRRAAGGAEGERPEEVERIIEERAREIAENLQDSLDFYAASAADSHIDKIAVTGGTAALAALRGTLASMTGIEIELANPFRAVHWDETTFRAREIEEWAPVAGVAVGLALRRTDER